MKNIYFIALILTVLITACHDEPDWLGDNTTTEGNHFPVIGTLTASSTTVSSGGSIELDMRYWSLDPIRETALIEKAEGAADFTIVDTYPYTFNFNAETQDEQLIMTYIAPAVSDTSEYEVGARVINENGLTRERTVSITVLP